MPSSGTILVVDDNRDDISLLLRSFKQVGIENPVKACWGADEAIEFLHTQELPALVLLDLKMPLKDGFYVLNRIRSNPDWKDLIVIVLTTSSDVADIRLAYELGANSFLTKPFNLNEFRDMVTAFHKYWVLQNQPVPKRGRVIEPPAELEEAS